MSQSAKYILSYFMYEVNLFPPIEVLETLQKLQLEYSVVKPIRKSMQQKAS